MADKRLLTVRATIQREGQRAVALEIRSEQLPEVPTPEQIAMAINQAFGKLNVAVREELL